MTDWMTIRVVLRGQAGHDLAQPPGRVLLAHVDHTLAELAEAIDTSFGRWDLTPLHQFEIDGRTLLSAGGGVDVDTDDDLDGTDDVTLGEVGLREGARFPYVFDLGEGWTHECAVEAVDVDPEELDGGAPEVPMAVYGWGTIPDQYGALVEDDEHPGLTADSDEEDEDDEGDDGWTAAAAASWGVVARALESEPRERDDDGLAAAASALRAGSDHGEDAEFGVAALFAAADLDVAEAPDDDEELWTLLAAGVVEPEGDVPLDDDLVMAWTGLDPADWAGAVIELVRSGTGTPATPESLIELVERCPEIEGEELTEEDEAVLLEGLEVVVGFWHTLGALDDTGALTPLGLWGIPRALERAWTGA